MINLRDYIEDVPDFPKEGILFRDIQPLLADSEAFYDAVYAMGELIDMENVDYFVGIESRGFIFASALASINLKGFKMIRKAGKLPDVNHVLHRVSYGLEYGQDSIEMKPGKGRVVIVDDVFATGGTMKAAESLCRMSGYEPIGKICLVNIGITKPNDIRCLIDYTQKPLLALFEYNDKIILSHAKRGLRMLSNNTMYLKESKIYEVSDSFFNDIKSKSIDKKIICLTRNPIEHISSGIWNVIEQLHTVQNNVLDKTIKEYKRIDEKFTSELFYNFMYITSTRDNPNLNTKNRKLKDTITDIELLSILNFYVYLFNKNYFSFKKMIIEDSHTNPNQELVQKIKENLECELVDMDEHNNLLKHLGFNISDTQNKIIKEKYSQNESKQFYKIFLNYIITQNYETVKSGFEKIYGNSDVVTKVSLKKIIKYQPIIDFFNKEVEIYNNIKLQKNE